jgi:hypothetical protein
MKWLLSENFGVTEFQTRNASQDSLEHLFAIIRSKNGSNDHPTAEQFLNSFCHVVFNRLSMPIVGENCEAASVDYLLNFNVTDRIT